MRTRGDDFEGFLFIAISLGILGAVAYVVFHFIAKFW
jgi:hypothetical protein